MSKRSGLAISTLSAVLVATMASNILAKPSDADPPQPSKANAAWLSGDFHQHTFYTDGSTSFDFVMAKNNEYGLDWWANSEHGGERNRNGDGLFWDDLGIAILGAFELSGGKREMWRWQSLRDYVFPDILENRELYPDRRIFSGLEWNVPGHEHCSTAVVAKDASAISAFEYQFDNSDDDFTAGDEAIEDITDDPVMIPYLPLTKQNGKINFVQRATAVGSTGKSYPDRHLDAVAGCRWMQEQYNSGLIDNAWIIFAHIERDGAWTADSGGGYNVEHFRDFNNVAPEVCFGFEGAPGHQVNNDRGFGNPVDCVDGICTSDDFGGTYGGVGFYSAKVGGLWDALLGEGRRWFNYANSDYHRHYTSGGDDFYPGEYQKTWVRAVDADGDGDFSLSEIADGLRSGNSYFVHGDLINHLEFEIQHANDKAAMGDELKAKGAIKDLKVKIKFKSPADNNCRIDGNFITRCVAPKVDHIDLIAGEITGKVDPSDPNYTNATNPTAKVIASFSSKSWQTDKEGYNTIVYHVKDVSKNTYFRLRGTNLACGTAYETGPVTTLPSADYCAPLADALVTQNLGIDLAQEAWDDLWFYSNPIFVYVK